MAGGPRGLLPARLAQGTLASVHMTAAPELVTTRSHWRWRPGWAPGRRMYTFHLTMERADAVRRLAADVGRALGGLPFVDPVPPQGLHLTMTGVGFADEVSDDQLGEVAEEVFGFWETLEGGTSEEAAGAAAPEIAFTGAFLGLEGAMLVAEPRDWLTELIRVQREAVDRVVGQRQWGGFWPHTALCYFNGQADPAPAARGLTAVLDAVPDRLEAPPTLTLMRLGRDEHVYAWEALRQA